MSQDDMKKEMRQLLMLISSIRSQDNERYEEHVTFSNEVIDFIKKIQENMNTNWEKIHKSLASLNKSVDDSLDSLLTGINPDGIKETSESLKEIMNTMEKSIQSMNLENVMRELRGVGGVDISFDSPKTSTKGTKATPLKAGLSTPYSSSTSQATPVQAEEDEESVGDLTPEEIAAYKEAYGGVLPPHLQPKKKKKKDTHLLKPSDFFGM